MIVSKSQLPSTTVLFKTTFTRTLWTINLLMKNNSWKWNDFWFKLFMFVWRVCYFIRRLAWQNFVSSNGWCMILLMVVFVLLLLELGVTKVRHVKRMMYVNGCVCVTSLGAWRDKSWTRQTHSPWHQSSLRRSVAQNSSKNRENGKSRGKGGKK